MPYDRTAPRKRPEDKHIHFNTTLAPDVIAILRAMPPRERGKAINTAIRAMYHPDDKQRRFAKLQALLIAIEIDES